MVVCLSYCKDTKTFLIGKIQFCTPTKIRTRTLGFGDLDATVNTIDVYDKLIFAIINYTSLLIQFLVYCTPTEIQTPIFPLEGERPVQLDDGGK